MANFYLQRFSSGWRQLVDENSQDAEKLRTMALALCERMTSAGTSDQIEKMRTAEEFDEFRKLVLAHKDTLKIGEGTERELALWVRCVCYCSTMALERQAV